MAVPQGRGSSRKSDAVKTCDGPPAHGSQGRRRPRRAGRPYDRRHGARGQGRRRHRRRERDRPGPGPSASTPRAREAVVVADLDATARMRSPPSWRRRDRARRSASAATSASTRTTRPSSTAAEETFGPIDLFFANAGVGVGTDLETTDDEWARSRWASTCTPTSTPPAAAARLARPGRGLLLLDGVGRRAAGPDRLGAVLRDQARRGRLRRVALHHLRRPGRAGQLPVPDGGQHATCSTAPTGRPAEPGRQRRAGGGRGARARGRRRGRGRGDRRGALPDPAPPRGRSTTSSARPRTRTGGWPACAACRPASTAE